MLRQINAAFPNRDKSSDGSIGDAAHASRSSDHNPYIVVGGVGIVRARDFTNDAPYMDSHKLGLALVASRDKRIKYVIDHGQICSGNGGPSPWKWRPYTGINQHDHHVHVSVVEDQKLFDDESLWNFSTMGADLPKPDSTPPATVNIIPKPPKYPTLRVKAIGPDVARLQTLLNAAGMGFNLSVDGDFGGTTEKAVIAFQTANKLVADGVVGIYTWKKLEA